MCIILQSEIVYVRPRSRLTLWKLDLAIFRSRNQNSTNQYWIADFAHGETYLPIFVAEQNSDGIDKTVSPVTLSSHMNPYHSPWGFVHTYTSTSTSPSARARENMKSTAYLCEEFTQRRVLYESELRVIPTGIRVQFARVMFRQLVRVLFCLHCSSLGF